jgi:oligopeptide/dipeptide ABC transporter ATP-binding protein
VTGPVLPALPVLPVLEADGLAKVYPAGGYGGRVKTALAGVSLRLEEGSCLGVVGESGCGKSTLARLLVGLERPTAGTVTLQGRPLASYPRPELARRLQLVSQDPFSSLNPRLTAGRALTEVLLVHRRVPGRREAAARVTELLDMVALGARFADRLPHEMSGGQAQRVAIARALAAEPQVLILDEPTSALDVSVRAGIVNLLARLRSELALSYLFISHDMAVIRQISDSIGVMYQGRFVERGPWQAVLSAPLHPYTRALLAAVPEPRPDGSLLAGAAADEPLPRDAGALGLALGGVGCPYLPRCPISIGRCRTEDPPLSVVVPEHEAACFRAGSVPASAASEARPADEARPAAEIRPADEARPAAEIRPADAADADAMAEVFVAAWRQAYLGVVPDAVLAGLGHDRTARWLGGLIDGGAEGDTDVAVRQGQVIGFVRYGTRHGEPGGYVFGLYVHPVWAGQGVGRALLRHAEQRLRERGSDTISLHVFEANERARRLYAKAGYAPDGSTRVEPEYEATEIRLVKALS